jgi:hypothetical protein
MMESYDDYSDAELIELFCENNDLEYRPYYSGRGMFGDNCVGIVVDRGSEFDTIRDLAIYMNEMGRELPHTKEDTMGMSMILYWESIKDTREYDEDNNEGEN